ncbi:hypothetical protein [Amycolatopsis jiangsuensis]|uniref:Uncharacterized protein n=1 Tax=Amycolatopsis jiangsuensis TaxID=1181879 RepID=A0A840IND5_9PSEU|nr:hypothetical protein [Amycolatopsis jiangsuensis]MBB4682718.1 hypothetical protein [Amycolatopsis jiangsuensis]
MANPHYPASPSDTAPLAAVPARPGPPSGPPPGSRPADRRTLLLRGGGLVVIAVVAGLVWYLVRHDSTPEQPVAQPSAQSQGFAFELVEGPVKATDCADNSYSGAKKYFQENPCTSLSRALYTAPSGSAKALVSVAVVTMPTAAQATALKQLTDTDGTGNVSDLVRDGTYHGSGAPKLSGDKAEYESEATGTDVTIVLADFYAGHQDPALLQRIAKDALKLSAKQR